jgi:hypothetical protein
MQGIVLLKEGNDSGALSRRYGFHEVMEEEEGG